eukprot:2127613-Pyramimonas_sp.AAC.1
MPASESTALGIPFESIRGMEGGGSTPRYASISMWLKRHRLVQLYVQWVCSKPWTGPPATGTQRVAKLSMAGSRTP